ncbi:MAG: Gfo/Idh/MocA family oxidoreductase [Bacteroidota bacterium]
MTKLRWGLLSTARINDALIKPLRNSDRNELIAVASRDSNRAQAYAREKNIPRALGSYEAMISDPEVDVIYISLPNSMHAEWTIKATQAGKHVLCEKPLAVTVEEVDAIAAAAKQARVIVMEAFMYRCHPLTLEVKKLVESGAIGKLRLVRGSFTFNISSASDVRLDPALGGGSIWDVGCYPISYTRMIVGAEPVEAFGWQMTGAGDVDETFIGQLRFPGEVHAQFDCGFRSPYRTHIQIVGSDGSLAVPRPFQPKLNERILLTNGDKERAITVPGQELYIGEVENMADAILHGTAPRISLADSRGNVATIQALLRSAREGRPITI